MVPLYALCSLLVCRFLICEQPKKVAENKKKSSINRKNYAPEKKNDNTKASPDKKIINYGKNIRVKRIENNKL
ncbi:MAG TPA: hypothetical protein VKY40_06215 [Halanaerobiales bacterium]|nr:hypothetical protein [Halanaerobiales bacterium]